MRFTRLAIAMLALLALVRSAAAEWPPGGTRVTLAFDSFNHTRMVRVLDLPSGDIAVMSVGVGGNAFGYSLQRVTPFGDLAAGWPADGLNLAQVGKSFSPSQNGFVVDDSGCAWHAAYGMISNRPSAQLARPDGGVLPSTYGSWSATTTYQAAGPMDVCDAQGGAYVVWGGRIQRLLRSGATAPGWPSNGLSLGGSWWETAVRPDGEGGAVGFGIAPGTSPVVQRVDANAVRHAGWPATGLTLSSDPNAADADFDPSWIDPLLPSGPDHFIAAWTTPYNSTVKSVHLQRFSIEGTLDPDWPTEGLLAVAPDTISGVTLLADGGGGVHVLWYAHGRAWGIHVLADGGVPDGMTGDPVELSGASAFFSLPMTFTGSGLVPLPYVVAAPASGGRLLFAFDDTHSAPARGYRVRWLLPDYTPDPSEPSEGRLVAPTAPLARWVRAVHADPVGGAYLAWEADDPDPGPYLSDIGEIWMTRLLPSALVGVTPPVAHSATLALSAPRPNPARGSVALDVTLPDDSPARVELLDVAGRVVRNQTVQGAGPHAVAFSDFASLAPGLYFARVSGRAGAASTRLVVSR
ncbi:MAG TPA: T9SS type A sorting domain-containing protein [Methylomirabilota bacterium]|nr:T9SS type A sorting domain-containing protein [Methylomirabilota bacterium]